MKFDLETLLSRIDINSLKTIDYGMKTYCNIVDYAIFTDNSSSIWYDVDDCIQISKCNENKKYTINYKFITKTISLKIVGFNKNNIVTSTNTIEFPDENYDEESFFMTSTVHNVGEFNFEMYDKFIQIVKRIQSIIKEIENEKSK